MQGSALRVFFTVLAGFPARTKLTLRRTQKAI